ncbi:MULTISPECIES: GTP-binding protein [Cyanophyceae]|uniref:CobW family GTP-binding protein n=1 Tax=Cyanophyceae TaxID=3028117 RepID=UPI00168228C5|nr:MULTISPECIES: GTP-binding protein [Cyanophyceae]MBD1914840.1 GTP-binding protein [Phormidium sp. FACHB-77]MBD2029958.1 GTP-binding protein [Phormidium sp. FACHB-322]MBD2049268.1 GTP-binding protein [Leptolyngbya sp. FACHB-60]
MPRRTPLTVVTGPLGSGKTTLLRHILSMVPRKLAILMNEFGEIAIDTKILQGKNVEMADLGGGCVCCSLLGEFEAAVDEIIATVNPDQIIVETTGVAEPDALVFDIQESLPQVRLDGVVTVMDADGLVAYPQIGHTTRIQIESADLILLNKVDLVTETELETVIHKLQSFNEVAVIVRTERCQVDLDLLFGIGRERLQPAPHHQHQIEFESFSYTSQLVCDRACFETFADSLVSDVYRAKGFIQLPEGTHLFNFVARRWDLEPFDAPATELVFIGKQVSQSQSDICDRLQACERASGE